MSEERDEARDALREKYAGKSIQELAFAMVALRDEKDAIEAQFKAVGAELDFLTKALLPEVMDEAGVSKISINGLGTLYLQGDIYVGTACDKQTLFDYLRNSGNGTLITETVNASTLKAWAKEQLKAGNEVPETIVKVQPYSFAKVLRK